MRTTAKKEIDQTGTGYYKKEKNKTDKGKSNSTKMSKPTVKTGGVTIPADLKGKDILKFMKDNLKVLIAEKKSANKFSDAISINTDFNTRMTIDKEGKLIKAADGFTPDMTAIATVLCVINTTNWMDSHSDVHMPGLWKRSITNNKYFTHLQEHTLRFDHIISDNAKGYTEKIKWQDLGFDAPGVTEALIFATPLTGRNEFMEDQYRKGYVKNHSVGMEYVVIKFCVNQPDEDYFKEEYANWVQYIDQVVNKDAAEANGYFWAVTEAKIIEGSAVPIGSNIITPTIGFKSADPALAIQQMHPDISTAIKDFDIVEAIKKTTFIN